MQPIHAWIRLWAVVQTLAVLFQILSKQTSIIAAAVHKHVSVLPSQKRYREYTPDSGTTGYIMIQIGIQIMIHHDLCIA